MGVGADGREIEEVMVDGEGRSGPRDALHLPLFAYIGNSTATCDLKWG